MHKKLEGELLSLAHSILQMKDKKDIGALQRKALLVYEKLSVLKFVNSYLDSDISEGNLNDDEEIEAPLQINDFTEKLIDTVEEKIAENNAVLEEENVAKTENSANNEEVTENIEAVSETISVEVKEEVTESIDVKSELVTEEKIEFTHEEVEEIFGTKDGIGLVKEEIKEEMREEAKAQKEDISKIQFSLEDEFKDAISSDVATQMFEKATKNSPTIKASSELKTRSLNDSLFTNKMQVGLNDRIAFVKHLFDGSQEDFSRVISQLNTFKTEEEAKGFVYNFVKPDYDWSNKEEYEARLIDLIERRF